MSLEKATQQLKAAFEKHNYQTCIKLLPVIKVELAKHNLLVPIVSSKVNAGDLIISRSILEIGALSAINLSNLELFEKFINELKPFYKLNDDIFVKNKSPNENKLYALYLLLLLTKGDISQFHIELLSLSSSELTQQDLSQLEDGAYLNYPIKIERWLMEGSYDKVWNLINNNNQTAAVDKNNNFKEFHLFNASLNHTLRNEIAKCLNVSYEKLPLANAKNLLFFEDEGKLIQFVKNSTSWNIANSVIYFNNEDDEAISGEAADEAAVLLDESQLDSGSQQQQQQQEKLQLGVSRLSTNELIIKNTLRYAAELETIV